MLKKVPASMERVIDADLVTLPQGISGVSGVLPDGSTVDFGGDQGRRTVVVRPGSSGPVALPQLKAQYISFAQVFAETDGQLALFGASSTDSADWSMALINLRTGHSRVVGRPEPGVTNDLPAIIPTAGDGMIAFAQSRPDKSLETHVVNASTGASRLVPWRNVAFPVIADHVLLAVTNPSGNWQNGLTYLVAFDLRRLQRVPLPALLKVVNDPRDIAVSKAGVAWDDAGLTHVYAVSTSHPESVYTAHRQDGEGWPYLSDNGFLGWYQNGGGPGSGVLGDTGTGAAVSVGNHVYISGDTIDIERFTSAGTKNFVLNTTELPRLTGCTPGPDRTKAQPSVLASLKPLTTSPTA